MKVFLVHRFHSKAAAVSQLRAIGKANRIGLHPTVLDSSSGNQWKDVALSGLEDCEAVVVYDPLACNDSENAAWEISKARELNKPIISLDGKGIADEDLQKLLALYNDDEEFNSYFRGEHGGNESLYKMMLDSSEKLVERRQTMNAFFITAMGALMALAAALAKFDTIESPIISFVVAAALGIGGLLLCNSWRNLIDNYGKLNTAKFRVITKLEKTLPAQIFAAEWAALGKGRRPLKYKSFTSTENLVPLWFAILIFVLLLFASSWRILS